MGKYVGIDLGTTFSVVAYVNSDGNVEIINNQEGQNITPSAVLFDGDNAIIGSDAKNESFTNADHYVAFAKRDMGSKVKKYVIGNESYSPEVISALVLKKLKNDAEAALDDTISGAVITVPAYFTDVQRKATMDAAEIAGINVLGIINEPTAAALAYGITKDNSKSMKIIVYDLGGGTFDVSIMQIDNDKLEILSTNGDSRMGGYDFDNVIGDMVREAASEKGLNIDDDKQACQQLQLRAEEIKKSFSAGRNKQKITVSVCGTNVSCEITKDEFENAIEPFIVNSIDILNISLDEANLEYSDIDKILLVGGSTRIPLVHSVISDETGITPSCDIHPDEAVAIGAAYHAVELAGKIPVNGTGSKESVPHGSDKDDVPTGDIPELKKEYTFTDRTSHGIGVQIWDDELQEDVFSLIVPKNSVLPAEEYRDYETVDDYQTELNLVIRQGEMTQLKYTRCIGETILKLRPKLKGNPIRVVISCDVNAIIHVSVIDLDDNENLGEMRIDRVDNLSDEDIAVARNKLGKLNIGME